MRKASGLEALPEAKRRELAFAVEVVREGFAKALSRRTQDRFRAGEILKIILFGSYARGDWVEDPVGRYFSDFDLLVVVNHEDLTDPSEFWGATEKRLLDELSSGERLRTPVSLIVHSFEDVNAQLKLGRYFFIDIVRDGLLLEETPDHPFVTPEPLTAEAALNETQAYFDEWFRSASSLLDTALYSRAKDESKEAAFLLHQSTERLYHCYLLVRSLYSPKTHSLNRLRTLCEELDHRLIAVWPKRSRFERRAYQLLRSAYVNARYSSKYLIAPDELSWLINQVAELQTMVDTLCRERLQTLLKPS